MYLPLLQLRHLLWMSALVLVWYLGLVTVHHPCVLGRRLMIQYLTRKGYLLLVRPLAPSRCWEAVYHVLAGRLL